MVLRLKKNNFHFLKFHSELYEAQRWNNDPSLWTPMAVLMNGQHLFIGDIFEYHNKVTGMCIGKAESFFYMVCIILDCSLLLSLDILITEKQGRTVCKFS